MLTLVCHYKSKKSAVPQTHSLEQYQRFSPTHLSELGWKQ